jgi:ATP-dependent HslUV protease subunit HslV
MIENQMKLRATTILGVKAGGRIAMGGDGQVTLGDTIVKGKAVKVRKMNGGKVLAGFAGSAADGMTLFDKFEKKLEVLPGDLLRAAVELAKEWRSDKYLRRLEAQLAVMNHQHIFLISGSGDILEPDDDVIAIGSGGAYAKSAALALLNHSGLSATQIVQEALQIAASICIYTNSNIQVIEP